LVVLDRALFVLYNLNKLGGLELKEIDKEKNGMRKDMVSMVREVIPKSPLIKEILGPIPKKFERILEKNGIEVIE